MRRHETTEPPPEPRPPVRLLVRGGTDEIVCRGCGASVPARSLPGFTVRHLICARIAALAA
jgi:hypothetical protein